MRLEAHLFELHLHGLWIARCDGVGDLMADAEGILFGFTRHVDEERICVAVDDMAAPLLGRVNERDGLQKRVSKSAADASGGCIVDAAAPFRATRGHTEQWRLQSGYEASDPRSSQRCSRR